MKKGFTRLQACRGEALYFLLLILNNYFTQFLMK